MRARSSPRPARHRDRVHTRESNRKRLAAPRSCLAREALLKAMPPLEFESPPFLVERLQAQRERIASAAERAGRDPRAVRLVAVSKFHPAAAIRAAYAAGQRDFGENYVQEMSAKAADLADLTELKWHLIGHLQSNKAKSIAGWVHCVQTVSTVKAAAELGKRALEKREQEKGALRVLVEVNVGGELSKSGCAPSELGDVLRAIDQQPNLSLVGLMTIPPASTDAEDARPFFAQLRTLRDLHGGVARLPELSMGMSHDAESAIAEGATWVRIGTAIFGERPRPAED